MADFEYTYLLTDFLNDSVDVSKLDTEIRHSSITASLDYINADEVNCYIYFRTELLSKDYTTLSGIVSVHDGKPDGIDDIQYVALKKADVSLGVDLNDEYRDRSGKLRVHQTSRKLGTIICWVGEGDDLSNPSLVGGGEKFSFIHLVGQEEQLIKYVDFNMLENETWLHEGYITWKDCYLDTLDLITVTRVTTCTSGTGTNYNLYNGYLIVPAVPGTGTIDVTSDITQHDGGLVYMPITDVGARPTAFWNAEWDVATKKFINISPAPAGDGKYNLFSKEISLAHFVRGMPLLNAGFIALNSSDTAQLGQGMRLKMVATTNTMGSSSGDHDWAVACVMCLHRERLI